MSGNFSSKYDRFYRVMHIGDSLNEIDYVQVSFKSSCNTYNNKTAVMKSNAAMVRKTVPEKTERLAT